MFYIFSSFLKWFIVCMFFCLSMGLCLWAQPNSGMATTILPEWKYGRSSEAPLVFVSWSEAGEIQLPASSLNSRVAWLAARLNVGSESVMFHFLGFHVWLCYNHSFEYVCEAASLRIMGVIDCQNQSQSCGTCVLKAGTRWVSQEVQKSSKPPCSHSQEIVA